MSANVNYGNVYSTLKYNSTHFRETFRRRGVSYNLPSNSNLAKSNIQYRFLMEAKTCPILILKYGYCVNGTEIFNKCWCLQKKILRSKSQNTIVEGYTRTHIKFPFRQNSFNSLFNHFLLLLKIQCFSLFSYKKFSYKKKKKKKNRVLFIAQLLHFNFDSIRKFTSINKFQII